MTKSKKMLALVIALVVMLVAVSGTLIAVLVVGNQNAQSTVHVRYTSSDVNVRVEAKYYIGSTGTDMVDKSNNNQTYVELNADKSNGSLDQPPTEVNLSKENNRIVYEYKFTNVSDNIPATISQLVEDGSVVVPKDSNNNVKLTYASSSTQLGAGASSDATTINTQGLPAGTTRYVYVIVSIVELLNDVDFEGTFGWDLAKGEAITSDSTGGGQSIVVDTTDVKLYNKSAMENIQLVVGVENTEPDYPMIEDKCFVGWFLDSGCNNKAIFPIIPTAETKLYPKHETATSGMVYSFYSAVDGYYLGDGIDAAYGNNTGKIVIPDAYDDGVNGLNKVTGINTCSFIESSEISEIIIPDSVTTIESQAFYDCSGLVSITIPDSVTTMGSGALGYCTSLTKVVIGLSVNEIGDYAFENCSLLNSVSFRNPYGWKLIDPMEGESSVTISTTDLSANATMLTTTHLAKTWTRG